MANYSQVSIKISGKMEINRMNDSKRYYWLKLKEDFFEDDTMKFLREQPHGSDYCIFYLLLCLKSLKTDGRLVRLVGDTIIPYDPRALAQLTGMREEVVVVAVELFLRYGILKQLDTGELYIQQVLEMVGSETYGAERKRKRRLQAIEKLIEDDVNSLESIVKITTQKSDQKNVNIVKNTIFEQKITEEKTKNGKISQEFPIYIELEKKKELELEKKLELEIASKETTKKSLKKSKTKKSKKEQLQRNYEIVCEEFKDEELRQSWWDFLEMRLEQHNKTYTEKGIRLKIKEFKNSIRGDVELGKAALDQAVAENWVGWHINESTKLLKNNYQPAVESGSGLYQPKDGEDITYQRMFELWKKCLGVSVPQTNENVKACKDLLDDIGEEWLKKLIVALRMRSQTYFVVKEVKAIQDFVGLASNKSMMMSFYDEHRKEWELKVREAQTGKKPWEL